MQTQARLDNAFLRMASRNPTHPTSIPSIPSRHSTHQTLPLFYIWILLACTLEMIPDLADVLCVFNEREFPPHGSFDPNNEYRRYLKECIACLGR